MGDLVNDVLAAQRDRAKLNELISDYLPFIKKQLSGLQGLRLEYDDMLSLAMLTFSGCVQQYALEKGNFLSFCSVCIRNRLLDESRRLKRYESKLTPLLGEEGPCEAEQDASLAAYNTAQEQASLAQEIQAFSLEIQEFGVRFDDLPRVCPKQARSRRLCARMAARIVATPPLYRAFRATGRIAQGELAAAFGVSPKTLEKHRRFIVALIVLMAGDYPYIQAFLPHTQEVV